MSRFLPIVALIIAIAIVFGYVSPTYSGAIAEKRGSIARQQTTLDLLTAFKKKQDELASAKNAISTEDLKRIDTFLPDSIDGINVIIDIATLASRSGVQISNITAASSVAGEVSDTVKPGTLDITLTAVGSYPTFRRFMAGIEQSLQLIDISKLTVKGSETGVYTYDMTLRLYWLP